MKISKVLIANHFFFTKSGHVHGPADVICQYFRNKRLQYQYLKLDYPLIPGRRPYFEEFNRGKMTARDFGLNINLPLPLKAFFEIVNSCATGIFFRADLFIGVDPLNALVGIILKNLGLVKKTIFYSVDYTPTRFENFFLNTSYQVIDKFCAKFSDEVWNVSSRIVELRKNQRIENKKIKYLPNTPNFNLCPRYPISKIDKNKIVMVTGLTHSPVFSLVLKSFKKVVQKYPNLTLNIIGSGDYENTLKIKVDKMKLGSNVMFLGQLENKEVLRQIAVCRFGLALYRFSKKYSWIYYGDSKKAREYLACGVPVIINDVVATSDDIERYCAGIKVKLNFNGVASAMHKLAGNDKFWMMCRRNAFLLAKDYDFEKILDSLLC